MKICDSFITATEKGDKRRDYFHELTKFAVALNGMVPLIIRAPVLLRYAAAENSAKTDFYLVSDNDVIPMIPDACLNVLEAIKSRPEIGILGFSPKRNITKKELGKRFLGDLGGGIWEVDVAKGIRFIRKGIVPTFPHEWDELRIERDWEKIDGATVSDDLAIAEMCRKKGYKVAMDTNNWFHHLGEGYSSLLFEIHEAYETK